MIRIPTITVKYNWRKKVNKSCSYPVHISIYLPGEPVRYYPIKIPSKIFADQWLGKENHWVNNNHPFYFEINSKITETVYKLYELIKRFYNQNKPVTFYAIEKELLLRGERNLFNDYFLNFIKHPPETVRLDEVTWEKYKACLYHINNFQSKITFLQIDETLIACFKNYLSDLKGRNGKMNPATIKSYFDKLKVVLNYAAKKDRFLDAKEIENYFDEIKIHVPTKKEGQHIEIEDLQKLKALVFDKKDLTLK